MAYYLEVVIWFFCVRHLVCYEVITQALWIGLKVVDFIMKPSEIF